VALLAITRRAFEYGVDVAGLARQIAVLTCEFKTRGQVIKQRPLD
jgi:hypothetical protein